MNKGISYTLLDIEIEICKKYAEARHQSNRKNKVKNSRIGPQSDLFIDWNGAAGEWAFCRIFNLFPYSVFDVKPRSAVQGEDKGGDILMHNGFTVDVKTTNCKDGRLLTPSWKKTGCVDYYALMIGDVLSKACFKFVGCIKEEELVIPDNLINLGYGKTYGVPQSKLYDFDCSRI